MTIRACLAQVAIVFWGSALIDPALMAPVDVILPPRYQQCAQALLNLQSLSAFLPTCLNQILLLLYYYCITTIIVIIVIIITIIIIVII